MPGQGWDQGQGWGTTGWSGKYLLSGDVRGVGMGMRWDEMGMGMGTGWRWEWGRRSRCWWRRGYQWDWGLRVGVGIGMSAWKGIRKLLGMAISMGISMGLEMSVELGLLIELG